VNDLNKLVFILILAIVASGLSMGVMAPEFDAILQGLGIFFETETDCDCIDESGVPTDCEFSPTPPLCSLPPP